METSTAVAPQFSGTAIATTEAKALVDEFELAVDNLREIVPTLRRDDPEKRKLTMIRVNAQGAIIKALKERGISKAESWSLVENLEASIENLVELGPTLSREDPERKKLAMARVNARGAIIQALIKN